MPNPVVFRPAFETPAADEAETIAALTQTLRGINETTVRDYGHAVRSVRAKSHGIVQGGMQVLDGLPETLAQGAFARPGTYPVVMRFSTNPGDILDDSVSAPRGLGLKIIGVEGERLPGSEGQAVQDFVMANAPAFAAPDPRAFLKLRLLAKTTDTPQGWKKAFSAVLRGAEAALESVGGKSATLTSLGGQPLTHVLGESFYTQAPVLWGPYIAKLSVVPASRELLALAGGKVSVHGRPNALREEVVAFLRDHGGTWEVRAQLCTDLGTMPIEDASVAWPEKESPYAAVARITVAPQPGWSAARSAAVDDGMGLQPLAGPRRALPARRHHAGAQGPLRDVRGVPQRAQWPPAARAAAG